MLLLDILCPELVPMQSKCALWSCRGHVIYEDLPKTAPVFLMTDKHVVALRKHPHPNW